MRWYHRLIAEKFDGSKTRKAHRRPRAHEEIEQLAVRVAEENPMWAISTDPGSLGESGALHRQTDHVQYPTSSSHGTCSATTQGPHGLGAVPEAALGSPCCHRLFHRGNGDVAWLGDVLRACGDGARHEARLSRWHYPRIPPRPSCNSVRQLTDPFDGFLLGKRYLIHDRDTKFRPESRVAVIRGNSR